MIKKIVKLIMTPFKRYKQHREYKKRLEELRKKDPFIYR